VGTLPRWQLRFPLRRVMTAELVAGAAVMALCAVAPWWAVAAVVAVIALVATVTYRGATTIQWLRRVTDVAGSRRKGRRRAARAVIPTPFNVELPGVGPIGMCWDGQYAITVIALHGREFAETVLVSEGVDTVDTVPLDACGALLEQFGGLELHSVDVVAEGTRTAPDGRFTPRYDEIISDRSAVGMRRTWLVLRLRPQACLQAIEYRGSVAEAAAAATERIRQAAARSGCRAVTCSPEQISEAAAALLDKHELASFEERWVDLRIADDYVTVYRIAGADLTTRLLSDVWTIRATKTVVLLRLTRDHETDALMVAALVRVHTRAPQTHTPISTLQSVPGQAFEGLAASLPLGDRSVTLDLSARPLATRPLAVPVGPSGFLHGMAERAGVPFLTSWTDPLKFMRVAIAASLDVVEALILRATAAGATAEIHTVRPQLWKPICDDTRIALARGQERSETATLFVADGPEPQQALAGSGERGHALVTIVTVGSPMPEDVDLKIHQVDADHISVQTPVRGKEITLGIMRPRNEAQSLSHLRSPRGTQR
jgi:type VII secretion protein EccE